MFMSAFRCTRVLFQKYPTSILSRDILVSRNALKNRSRSEKRKVKALKCLNDCLDDLNDPIQGGLAYVTSAEQVRALADHLPHKIAARRAEAARIRAENGSAEAEPETEEETRGESEGCKITQEDWQNLPWDGVGVVVSKHLGRGLKSTIEKVAKEEKLTCTLHRKIVIKK